MWLIHQFDSLLRLGDCKEYPNMAKTKTPRTNTRSKTNGSTPETVTTTAEMQAAQPELKEIKRALSEVRQNVVPINLDEEIRRRAYELWEQCGHEPGHENEHWLLAEQEIAARYNVQRQHSA
jgi:hypothetical protein